ncbi:MAG: asparagine synthase-related protein [Promethearchaeota archaeon]
MTDFYLELSLNGFSSIDSVYLKKLFRKKFPKTEFVEQGAFLLYAADFDEKNFQIQNQNSITYFSMNHIEFPVLNADKTIVPRKRQVGLAPLISYDKEKHTIEIVTDPFGLKYIFVASIDKNKIAFSSHLKYLLLMNPGLLNKLDYDSIVQFLFSHFILAEKSFFKEIKLLPYNSIIKIKNWGKNSAQAIEKGLSEKEAWFNFPTKYDEEIEDPTERAKETGNIIQALLRTIYVNQDQKVAFMLSGGLDSRTLVATIPEEFKNESIAITFDSSAQGIEISKAKSVCKTVGIPHSTQIIGASDIVKNSFRHMWINEGLSNHAVSILLSLIESVEEPVVFIDGTPGDAQFGGGFVPDAEEVLASAEKKASDTRIFEMVQVHGYSAPEESFFPSINNDKEKIMRILRQGFKEQSELMWETENEALELESLLVQTRCRYYTIGGAYKTVSEYGPVVLPYYHPEVFAKFVTVPPRFRKNRQFELLTLAHINKDLAEQPTTALNWLVKLKSAAPHGLKRFMLRLEALTQKRLVPLTSAVPYAEWIRENKSYRRLIESLILEDKSLIWNILNKNSTQKIFRDFLKRKNPYKKFLLNVIDLEIIFRLFFSLKEDDSEILMISETTNDKISFRVGLSLENLQTLTKPDL